MASNSGLINITRKLYRHEMFDGSDDKLNLEIIPNGSFFSSSIMRDEQENNALLSDRSA